MIQKITFIFAISFSLLSAKDSISIEEILKSHFTQTSIEVEKKSLILTKEEAKEIQSRAKSKIDSKIVRYYRISDETGILGNAILLQKRIRTKNAAVLYIVDNNNSMVGLEIINFKEPIEYKPSRTWQEIFIGKSSEDTLRAGDDIPTISGATLSARAISQSARLALAIAQNKLFSPE